jgi:phthiocerol/phenolphthiocerol synthesis type-I polyketide synthase D
VDAVVAVVDAQGKLARRVEVDVASHHPTVDPILGELRSELADLAPRAPKIPLLTTVVDEGVVPAFDAAYWVDNLRKPVRFSRAVAEAAANHATFVEVSPHPLLTHAINGTLESARPKGDVQVGGTLYRDNPETLTFHTQLAAIRPSTAKSAKDAETDSGARSFIDLPPTPWQHVRYWTSASAAARQPAHAHPLLGQHVEMPTGDHVWQGDVGTDAVPYMVDHIVHGQAVMPATGFAEIALAAGCEALGLPAERVAVNRVEVEQMLRLDGSTRSPPSCSAPTAEARRDPFLRHGRQLASARGGNDRSDRAATPPPGFKRPVPRTARSSRRRICMPVCAAPGCTTPRHSRR